MSAHKRNTSTMEEKEDIKKQDSEDSSSCCSQEHHPNVQEGDQDIKYPVDDPPLPQNYAKSWGPPDPAGQPFLYQGHMPGIHPDRGNYGNESYCVQPYGTPAYITQHAAHVVIAPGTVAEMDVKYPPGTAPMPPSYAKCCGPQDPAGQPFLYPSQKPGYHPDHGCYGNENYCPPPYGQQQAAFTCQPTYVTQQHGVQVIGPPQTIGDMDRDEAPPHVPNYLFLSIFSCLCCCWITGIIAIMNANKANDLKSQGRFVEAAESARYSRTCSLISIAIGVICTTVSIIYNLMKFMDTSY